MHQFCHYATFEIPIQVKLITRKQRLLNDKTRPPPKTLLGTSYFRLKYQMRLFIHTNSTQLLTNVYYLLRYSIADNNIFPV